MILTAFLIGLAGSLHCVGMCSPLATAVAALSPRAATNRMLYNGGRILVYGVMGAGVGAFGALAGLTSYQVWLSATLGALLILFGLSGIQAIRMPMVTPIFQHFTAWLKKAFASQLKSGTRMSLLGMGIINGMLPCGLTYFALTYCITLPSASQGFLFMMTFGAGTLPVMLGLPWVIQVVSNRFRWQVQRVITVVMIILGALLVARSAYFLNQPHAQSAAQATEVICP